ncbi:MAG: glycosyltransferase, partial [Planctomycetia bacterium]
RSLLIATVAGWFTRLPVVYHVHSPAAADSTKRWSNRINAMIERFCMGWVTAMIPVSESLGKRTIASGCAAEKVHVVRNGVPAREVRPVRSAEEKEWTLGTIALFRPRKGTEVLLDAIAGLREQELPVRLQAVGPFETDEYGQELKERVKRLRIADAVEWTGFTSDVDAELAKMDLFVLPSLFGEGLPMVVIEAMAAGVPVIASRVEGIPEAVREGVDGLLFEPNDVEGLIAAARQFIDGKIDWAACHRQEVDRHAEAFSTESMASGVAGVYEQMMGY